MAACIDGMSNFDPAQGMAPDFHHYLQDADASGQFLQGQQGNCTAADGQQSQVAVDANNQCYDQNMILAQQLMMSPQTSGACTPATNQFVMQPGFDMFNGFEPMVMQMQLQASGMVTPPQSYGQFPMAPQNGLVFDMMGGDASGFPTQQHTMLQAAWDGSGFPTMMQQQQQQPEMFFVDAFGNMASSTSGAAFMPMNNMMQQGFLQPPNMSLMPMSSNFEGLSPPSEVQMSNSQRPLAPILNQRKPADKHSLPATGPLDGGMVVAFARDVLHFACGQKVADEIAQNSNSEENDANAKGKRLLDRSLRIRSRLVMAKKMAELQASFDRWDKDADGFLNEGELKFFVQQEYGFRLSDEEVKNLFVKVVGHCCEGDGEENLDSIIKIPIHKFEDLKTKVSRMRWSRPRSESEVNDAECRAAAMTILVNEARGASARAEKIRQEVRRHCENNDAGPVSECLRSAQDAQAVIAKARTSIGSLKISIQGNNNDRLKKVTLALDDLDSQLLVEQKKVQQVMSEIHRLRGANFPSGDRKRMRTSRTTTDDDDDDDVDEEIAELTNNSNATASNFQPEGASEKEESSDDPRLASRLRVRGTLSSMLKKVQTANLRILRWSRLRALKALDSALKSQEISPEEHAFISNRVDDECAVAAMRVVNQHARETYFKSDETACARDINFASQVIADMTSDLGGYLSGFVSLRGSVRLLVECLKNVKPETWANQIFTDPVFRCRLNTPVTRGTKMFSRLHRTLSVGECVQAVGKPFFIDGHQRVRVRLSDGQEGYVSIRNNEKFFLLEVFPHDDADTTRWVSVSEDRAQKISSGTIKNEISESVFESFRSSSAAEAQQTSTAIVSFEANVARDSSSSETWLE